EIVPDFFDARRDGRSRVYEYRILNRSTPSPFHLNRAWQVHEYLDVEAMREAIRCLAGEHDFSSFRAAGCDAVHPVRKVYRISLDDRKSTRLNSSHQIISYAVFCLKKKKK